MKGEGVKFDVGLLFVAPGALNRCEQNTLVNIIKLHVVWIKEGQERLPKLKFKLLKKLTNQIQIFSFLV